MSDNLLTQKARDERAAYKREWRRKNPGKNKEYIARYWEKRAGNANIKNDLSAKGIKEA